MKKSILALAFLALTVPASAGNDVQQFIAATLAEVRHLDTLCGTVAIDPARQDGFLRSAGIAPAQLDSGGDLEGAYLAASIHAADLYSGLGADAACFHLKQKFGPEGSAVANLVK